MKKNILFFILISLSFSLLAGDRRFKQLPEYKLLNVPSSKPSRVQRFKKWLKREDAREKIQYVGCFVGGVIATHICWRYRWALLDSFFNLFGSGLNDQLVINGVACCGAQTEYHGVVLRQKRVPYQHGATCGFCSVRDAANVVRNIQGQPDGDIDAWRQRFDRQYKQVQAYRASFGERNVKSVYTDRTEVDAHIVPGEQLPCEHMAIEDFSPDRIAHEFGEFPTHTIHNSIARNGAYVFLIGNMRQRGDRGCSNGHWISLTVYANAQGQHEYVVTDSMNNNKLNDEKVHWIIDQLEA